MLKLKENLYKISILSNYVVAFFSHIVLMLTNFLFVIQYASKNGDVISHHWLVFHLDEVSVKPNIP